MQTKRELVATLVERFRHPLGLVDYDLRLEFVSLKHRADCEARPEYNEAIIRFDLKKIRREQLPAFVLHEMIHCLVWKLAAVGERLSAGRDADLEAVRVEEESLVTLLERVLLPLLYKE
jgi:hypothetical protein